MKTGERIPVSSFGEQRALTATKESKSDFDRSVTCRKSSGAAGAPRRFAHIFHMDFLRTIFHYP
ncbi:hypothetical protein [Metallibacterium sp.]|jgi:hypothetical protein|uniref:hypothetical protein n=1 Tax=Metallibacterium sp. TaxID=2940281 RepID=UPI002616E712|nr:hypothetical protein [Metallibacterium sp.]